MLSQHTILAHNILLDIYENTLEAEGSGRRVGR
jgi:hypothetical protein